MDKIPTVEAKIGNDIYKFQIDPNLKEFDFRNAIKNKRKSFKSKFLNKETISISVWTTPKRTKTYPFPRVYSTLGENGKKITIIPVQASYGKYGDKNKIQPGTIYWMTELGVYVIVGVFINAKSKKKGKPAANKKAGKISTEGELVFSDFEFDLDDLEEQINEIIEKNPSVEEWNQKQTNKIPKLLEYATERNKELGGELGVQVQNFNSLEKKLKIWVKDFPAYLADCDKESLGAQKRETSGEQKLENVPGVKGKINVDMGNSKKLFLTSDSMSIDENKKNIEILEGKHSTRGKFPNENDVLDALFKLMIFKKSDFKINGVKYTKKLVCYLSGIIPATDEEIKKEYKELIQECKNNDIEFRFNDKTIK